MAPQLTLLPNRVWNHLLGTPSFEFDNGVSSDSENASTIVGGAFVSNPSTTASTSTASFDILIRHFEADGKLAWSALNGSTYNDIGYGITTGIDGEIYITGQTEGNLNDEINSGKSDIFISRYEKDGIRAWTKLLGTSSDDYGYAITTASNGDIWVTGSTEGNLGSEINNGKKDVFVSCYNSLGELKWVKLIGGNGNDIGTSIATGPFGSVCITGTSTSNNNGFNNVGGTDIFVALILADGRMLWLKNIGSSLDDSANSIVLDKEYNIYIAGSTKGEINNQINNGGSDILLSALTFGGDYLWSKTQGTSVEDKGESLAIGLDGNIYLAATTNGNLNGEENKGFSDVAISAHDTNGNQLWTSLFGSDQIDVAAGLNSTKDGRLILVGSTNGNFEGEINQGTRDVFTKSVYPSNPPSGITISNMVLMENTAVGTEFATISGIDLDVDAKFTYSLIGGPELIDDAYFAIDGNKLIIKKSPDYEHKNQLKFRLRANDQGGLYVDEDFVVSITDISEAPSQITIFKSKFDENSAIGSVLTNIISYDPDIDSKVKLELIAGLGSDDNDSFKISNNQLVLDKKLNFEQKNSYSIRVEASDNELNKYAQVFQLFINDINEAPTDIIATNIFINETVKSNSTVSLLTTTDEDVNDRFLYYLAPNFKKSNDNDYFYIDRNELKLKSTPSNNIEIYSIRIATSDKQGLTFEKDIELVVNRAPTDIKISTNTIPENQAPNRKIGVLETIDPNINDQFSYKLDDNSSDTDNKHFFIANNQLFMKKMANYEKKNIYNIKVQSEDQGGLKTNKPLTILVEDLVEPTTLKLTVNTINENTPAFRNVAEILGYHTNGSTSYEFGLVSGDGDTHNNLFQINSTFLQNKELIDFEKINIYHVRIGATDQAGEYSEHELEISVTNANEAPTKILLSNNYINETITTATPLAIITSEDPDVANKFSYSLISGSGAIDNNLFEIIQDKLYIKQSGLNLKKNNYQLRIRSTDQDGLMLDQAFNLIYNKKPTSIELSDIRFEENLRKGSTIAEINSTDPDANSKHRFSLSEGTGDKDNEFFSIVNEISLTATGRSDVFISKIDKYGNFIWATKAGGENDDYIYSIMSDLDGSSTIEGNFSGSANFSDITLRSSTKDEYFTAKLDSNGNYTSAEVSENKNTETSNIKSVLSDGSQIIAGTFSNNKILGARSLQSRGNKDVFIAKQNKDGSYDWATSAGGSDYDSVFAISSIDNNSTFITGTFSGSASFGDTTLISSSEQEIFIAKLNADGTFAWANKVGGFGNDYVKSIKGQNDGSSFIIGTFTGVASFGGTSLNSFGEEDIFIAKLNANGSFSWVTQAGGFNKDYGIDISPLADGSTLITGEFTGKANFGNIGLTSAGNSDVYIAKLNINGEFEWVRRAGGESSDKSHSIKTHEDGSSIITGTFIGTSNWEEKSRLVMNKFADYEQQQLYDLRLKATDEYGLFTESNLTLNIENRKELSEILFSNNLFNESLVTGETVCKLSVSDIDPLTNISYEFISKNQNDNNLFLLEGNQLKLNHSPNYKQKNNYLIEVEAKDNEGNIYFSEFTLTLNGRPNDIQLSTYSLSATTLPDSVIANLITVDPNSEDTFKYEIVKNFENQIFSIHHNKLVLNQKPADGLKSDYILKIKSTDRLGLSVEKDLQLNILKATSNINLSSILIPENTNGSSIATIFTDSLIGDQDTIFSLVDGNGSQDNNKFEIKNNILFIKEEINFENKSSYNIRLKTTEPNGFSIQKEFLLSVTDINEPPSMLNLSNSTFPENIVQGSIIADIIAIDPDVYDTTYFELIDNYESGNDNANFQILNNKLILIVDSNYEKKPFYEIDIRATDSSRQFMTKRFRLESEDINEAPTQITISNANILENISPNSFIGELSHNDPDKNDIILFELISDNNQSDNVNFSIVDNNKLLIQVTPDFEAKPLYKLLLKATDARGLQKEQELLLKVLDINEAPEKILLSSTFIPYTLGLNGKVSILSTIDPDIKNSFRYEILSVTGTDFQNFNIQANTIYLNQKKANELKTNNTIVIRSTDQNGLFLDQIVNITLQKKPITMSLVEKNINENTSAEFISIILSDLDELSTNINYNLTDPLQNTDNNLFTIEGNKLKIKTLPNYEDKSNYTIKIQAVVMGEIRGETELNLPINNLNEAPINLSLSKLNIDENLSSGSVVATISSIDEDRNDSTTYIFADSLLNDNRNFRISGNKLITMKQTDFETKQNYKLKIRAVDDQGLFNEKIFEINVNDLNEAPSIISLSTNSFVENLPADSVIANLLSLDPDSDDQIFYTFAQGIGDNHNSSFKIEKGKLKITNTADYETQNVYYLRIRATDTQGLFIEQNFELNVANANEAPTSIVASNQTISSALTAGSTISYLITNDQDIQDIHQLSLVPGIGSSDNNIFKIEQNELKFASIPNYEGQNYQIRVRSTDKSGLFAESAINFKLPQSVVVSPKSIIENVPASSTVATISLNYFNVDDTYEFYLLPNSVYADNDAFGVRDNLLIINESPDYETKNSYYLGIAARNKHNGNVFENEVIIKIQDTNEKPSRLDISQLTINRNTPQNNVIATLKGIDPDLGSSFSYQISDDNSLDNLSRFSITQDKLILNSTISDIDETTFNLKIRAIDSLGAYHDEIVNLNVIDTVTLNNEFVSENIPIGSSIANLSTTELSQKGTKQFSLLSELEATDNKFFFIEGDKLKTLAPVDFENKSSYNIKIKAIDLLSKDIISDILINVVDINEAPTDIKLSNLSVKENSSTNSIVAYLNADDPEESKSIKFNLVSGDGDNHNSLFSITDNRLLITRLIDYEKEPELLIRLKATDPGGNSIEKLFNIAVINENESPELIKSSSLLININSPARSLVSILSSADPDANDLITYSLDTSLENDDSEFFILTGNALRLQNQITNSSKQKYNLNIKAKDKLGLEVNELFTYEINSIPLEILASNLAFKENTIIGSEILEFTCVDTDINDTFVYSFVPGQGANDNDQFLINGNKLVINKPSNFEKKSIYSIKIRSTDRGGLSVEKIFSLKVENVNEPPEDIILSSYQIHENAPADSIVSLIRTEDPDKMNQFTYEIRPIKDNLDSNAFYLDGDKLKIISALDYERQPNYLIRLRTTDQDGLSFEKDVSINVINITEAVYSASSISLPTSKDTLVLIGDEPINATGNISANKLVGNNNNNRIEGELGPDLLTGLLGSDTFIYTSSQDSNLRSFDHITDLIVGTDLIDATYPIAPGRIQEIGFINEITETELINTLSETNFKAQAGIVFQYFDASIGRRSFLALNDNQPGFSSINDTIIEITGYSNSITGLGII